MNNFFLYFAGYREYSVDKKDIATLSELLMKNNVSAAIYDGRVKIPLYKCKHFEALVSPRVKYSVTEARGMGGKVAKMFRAYGLLLGVITAMLIWFASSQVVWDVRIDGNADVDDEQIVRELSAVGFRKGIAWRSIDLSEIELTLLSSSDTVSWVNINRNGAVAYVKVIEKQSHSAEDIMGYANVVAKSDGVIEEITVKKGRASVAVGDTVKKGDLLISGVLPDGTLCYAEGVVVARISETLTVFTGRKDVSKEYSDGFYNKICCVFFDNKINILKKYGNSPTNCDIIDLKKDFYLFGAILPISFTAQKYIPYTTVEYSLTDTEMVDRASLALQTLLGQRLSSATLLKAKCDGEFCNDGYKMWANVVFSEDIGVQLPFDATE